MKRPKINWSAIRREVSTGESYKVVGERYGVKPSRISMKAHRERWEIRELRKMMGKAGPAWQTETVIKNIEAEVESLGKTMMTGSLRVRLALTRLLERALHYLETKGDAELAAETKAIAALGQVAERVYRWDKEPPPPDPRVTPAINLALVHTSPAEMRAMAKARKAEPAKDAGSARVVGESAGFQGEDAMLESDAKESKPLTVRRSDLNDGADRDDVARREERPWWEDERARKLARESLGGKEGSVASNVSDQGALRSMSELEAQRAQQREESRQNFERGRR
jgi:hypothetical protein